MTTKTTNWDDPASRLDLIERVGASEYRRLFDEHQKQSVIVTVCGHEIRPVATRFGRLYSVGSTGRAFSTQGEAETYARCHPWVKE